MTAYLDGELEDDRGSAVRGHLRGCAACRDLAEAEAALRDGLRALPPLEPPPSLWAGVQRELAAAEVRDAETPAWRRWIARWAPQAPQIAIGSAALAVAVGVLAWRYHDRANQPAGSGSLATAAPVETPSGVPDDPSRVEHPAPPPSTTVQPPIAGDVTQEIADDTARTTATYKQAADELAGLARAARAQWPDDRKLAFDGKLAGFERELAAAADGRPRQKVYRAMIRYLQGVAIRDEVAANEPALAGRAP